MNFKQGRVWTAALGGAMAVAMVFGASQALAVISTQTNDYTVSVVVDNAFTITETTAMSFGTIAALNSTTSGDVATLSIDGQTGIGTIVNGTTARIIVITAGTPGVVTVTGAPPSTAMTIGNPIAVTNGLDNPASTVEARFDHDMNAAGLAFNSTTDAAGELVIQVGGIITTEVHASNTYVDGTYTGTYSLTVSY